jgi:hypothetical protein
MNFWRWVAACAFGCALGCSDATPGQVTEVRVESIVAGEPSGAEQDGTVLLRAVLADGSEGVCSASLVGPNLIVTAAHCVAYQTDGDFSCSVRGELIDNASGGGRLGLHLPAASLEVYGGEAPRKSALAHGLKVISTLSPHVCQNDLAFVVLDTALELPVMPMRLGRPALVHETVVLVGYGTSRNDGYIDYRTQPRQQRWGHRHTTARARGRRAVRLRWRQRGAAAGGGHRSRARCVLAATRRQLRGPSRALATRPPTAVPRVDRRSLRGGRLRAGAGAHARSGRSGRSQ